MKDNIIYFIKNKQEEKITTIVSMLLDYWLVVRDQLMMTILVHRLLTPRRRKEKQ